MVAAIELVVYASVPAVLVLGAIVWSGAHSVAALMLGLLVIVLPLLYFVMNAAAFDRYWVQKRLQRGPEVVIVICNLKYLPPLYSYSWYVFTTALLGRLRRARICKNETLREQARE
jgi:hypothetical protein